MNSKLEVNEEIVESTRKLMNLAIEIDEYWRRTSPFHELSQENVENLLRLLSEVEGVVSKLKERLHFKP
ncbi:MAG: hypothetical protein ACXQTB_00835 [Candidatus Nezhaarchaeales archaeon]